MSGSFTGFQVALPSVLTYMPLKLVPTNTVSASVLETSRLSAFDGKENALAQAAPPVSLR